MLGLLLLRLECLGTGVHELKGPPDCAASAPPQDSMWSLGSRETAPASATIERHLLSGPLIEDLWVPEQGQKQFRDRLEGWGVERGEQRGMDSKDTEVKGKNMISGSQREVAFAPYHSFQSLETLWLSELGLLLVTSGSRTSYNAQDVSLCKDWATPHADGVTAGYQIQLRNFQLSCVGKILM